MLVLHAHLGEPRAGLRLEEGAQGPRGGRANAGGVGHGHRGLEKQGGARLELLREGPLQERGGVADPSCRGRGEEGLGSVLINDGGKYMEESSS